MPVCVIDEMDSDVVVVADADVWMIGIAGETMKPESRLSSVRATLISVGEPSNRYDPAQT
jgi:hypothetical protein